MGDLSFCCTGCKSVYLMLNANGLCEYYELNPNPGSTLISNTHKDRFAFLDREEIAKKIIKFQDHDYTHLQLYIPQIHCSSCLYLLENIHKLNSGITESRVNFETKEIFLTYDHQVTSLRKVIETLVQIGYEPHLSLAEIPQGISYDKSRLYKIGLAGFAFSNIMLFSFMDYLAVLNTIDPLIKNFISYLSLALAFPVISYCASEFFTNSWKGLVRQHINIDLPIALSLLITFGRSVYEIFSGYGPGYLDSMTGIVFFMLIGRWMQSRTTTSHSFNRDYKSFFPIAVTKLDKNQLIPTEVSDIKENDVIMVHSGEIIPVDGILSKGKAQIDYSFVNGESSIQSIDIGHIIYAGGKHLGSVIEIIVIKPHAQSYLTNLWNKSKLKSNTKNDSDEYYDRLAAIFGIVVLILGFGSFIYWWWLGESSRMWNSISTVFIIACPCALLLAKTYTSGFYLRFFNNLKIYLRSAEILPLFNQITHIVFDKTGTLTEIENQEVRYYGRKLNPEERILVSTLCQSSLHPYSYSIFQFLNEKKNCTIESFKNHESKGIEAWVNDHHVKLGSRSFIGGEVTDLKASKVILSIDGKITGEFTIQNKYKPGTYELLQDLIQNYEVSLVSGDNNAEEDRINSITKKRVKLFFNQNPEQKRSYVEKLQNSGQKVMMLGDGLNDSTALNQADLGIAIMNSSNGFTPASDIIIKSDNIAALPKIIKYTSRYRMVVNTIFVFSIVYNILGLYFAMQGNLHPLIAAVLMPLSSVTILSLSYVATIPPKEINLERNHNQNLS